LNTNIRASLGASLAALAASLSLVLSPGASSGNEKPPNILLAIADDWGYGHAGAYGCQWIETPAFDRIAREGLLFDRAYTPNAKCAPSRACLLTGRYSWQLKEAANHICYFPPEFKTWPEWLVEAGWTVGYTGKGWGPGVALDAEGRPRAMTGHLFSKRRLETPLPAIAPNDYAANFAEFLEAAPADQPWCFWYGALEPHRDYSPGAGERAGKKPASIDRVPGYWPDQPIVRQDMLDYAVEVEHFDRHLGKMLELLASRELLDNTLVIVTSDHGPPFPRCKGNAYEASNHVPLAVRWPKLIRAHGARVRDYVSFVDLAPTIVEIVGAQWSDTGLAETPGKSLTDLMRKEANADEDLPHDNAGELPLDATGDPARDHTLVGMERHDIGRPGDVGYPIRGIVRGEMLYLHNFEPARWPACNPETGYLNCDGGPTKTLILAERRKAPNDEYWSSYWRLCFGKRPAEELYDLQNDVDCLHNLANDPRRENEKRALREQLFAELTKQGDPRMSGEGQVFDEYPHANEAHRGFFEKHQRGEKLKAPWVNESDFEPQPIEE
jgi:N-sulfoglucosamine sulfohydrolase